MSELAESTYKTIGHGQVDVYAFPVMAHGATWAGGLTVAQTFTAAQVDRCQSIGLGAFDAAFRKRWETGRTTATEEIASSSIDKPATIERLEDGQPRSWNNLAGKEYDATADIDQDDFDATTSEVCIIMHKLNDAKTTVIESDVLWRLTVDTWGVSVPNSEDDDVRISVRLTGDEHAMCSNSAGKAIAWIDTASGGVITLESGLDDVVELDDWPEDDDGSAAITVTTADPGAGDTSLTVRSSSLFSEGQDVLVWSSADSWETGKIASIGGATNITLQDQLDEDHHAGAIVKRTRGFFFFVNNADTPEYLDLGTDYRVVRTGANVTTILNVDGGTKIGTTDDLWMAWCIASGAELWTNNTSDPYGIVHTQCKFVIAPESTFVESTVGFAGAAVAEDVELDFVTSGTDADLEWFAYRFTAAATGKVDAVSFFGLTINGAPTGQVHCEIYSDTGGPLPDAQTGNPSQPIAIADITALETADVFRFTDGPDLTGTTDYWAVLKTGAYTYNDGVTDLILNVWDDAASGVELVAKGDPNGVWSAAAPYDDYKAYVSVSLIGSQEIKRIQGMDISTTFSRTQYNEMGNPLSIERSFDETDVRVTVPMMMSDITTWARVIDKNAASVKTTKPEQSPEVNARLEIYSNTAKNAGDALLTYEMLAIKRSGGEKTANANDRGTKRVTLSGSQFNITFAPTAL